MNIYLKWIIRILSGIVGLAIILIVYVSLFIDPNDYKDEIYAWVKTETGRELSIKGEIALSVFPWTGLELSQVTLAESDAYSQKYLAQMHRLDVKVSFWSLLTGKLKAKSIKITGLKLNLEVNRKGKFNLDELISSANSQAEMPATKNDNEEAADFEVDQVEITDSEIVYRDQMSGTYYAVTKFSLRTQGLGQAGAKDLRVKLAYQAAQNLKPLNISFRGKVEFVPQSGKLVIQGIELLIDKLKLNGHFSGLDMNEKAKFSGAINTNQFVLSNLLKKLGIKFPKLNDSKVLANTKISFNYAFVDSKITLSKLDVKLDDSLITGKASAILSRDYPPFFINFNIDQLDLDRYLPKTQPAKPLPKKQKKRRSTAGLTAANSIIPELVMRELQGNGTIRIKKLTASGMKMTNVQLGVTASKGRLRFYPLRANLYGGVYGGDTQIKVYKRRVPQLSTNEKFKNVQAAEVSQSFIPKSVKENIGLTRILGVLNMNSSLSTTGRSARQFQENLHGQLDFSFRDGKLEGVSPIYRVCQLYNLSRGREMPAYSTEFEKFADLVGSIRFRRGRGTIGKLRIDGHLYQAVARGYFDLRLEYFDIKLKIVVSNNCDLNNRDSGSRSKLELEMRCKGSFNSSKQPCKANVKKLIKKQLLKRLFKSKSRDDEPRSDKDRLKNELFKGLFGD